MKMERSSWEEKLKLKNGKPSKHAHELKHLYLAYWRMPHEVPPDTVIYE